MSRRERIARIEDAIKDLSEDLEILKAEPVEPKPERSVVFFEKSFTSHGLPYTYVAIKAAGKWWPSGTINRGLSWTELLDFIGTSLPTLRIATLPYNWDALKAGQK